MTLRKDLSSWWFNIQTNLFPWLQETLGDMTEKQMQLISTLELIRIEEHIPSLPQHTGRPPHSRIAIARAFVAKAVYNLPTTEALLDRLKCDKQLRIICGWERIKELPSASVFSRAFFEFSQSRQCTLFSVNSIEADLKQSLI